ISNRSIDTDWHRMRRHRGWHCLIVASVDTETAYLRRSWTRSMDRTMMCSNPEFGALSWTLVWLRSFGLGKYEAAFRENEINERVLPSLTAEDLKEIGVGPVGHRRILLEAIATLRGEGNATAPSAERAFTAPVVSAEDRAERRQVTVMFSDLVGSTA